MILFRIILGFVFLAMALYIMITRGLDTADNLVIFYGNLIIANIYFTSGD